MMPQCSDCSREFLTSQALHAHCRDRADHAYCEVCERLFVHENALNQHLENSSSHQDASEDDESDFSEGDQEYTNDDPPFCSSCNRRFVDGMGLYQHLSASLKHNWCFICSRDFSSNVALAQHLSSRVHKARDLKCPLCSKAFKTPSAIALHIESGACHNIDRHLVTAAVHSLKVVPTISISRRLHGPASANQSTTHYSASERAFNGSAYECYLCHSTFRTLASLNMHLSSPAHDDDEFNCPKCKRPYKLISGLIQHIETEACGLARFEQVEDHTNALTAQFARLLKF